MGRFTSQISTLRNSKTEINEALTGKLGGAVNVNLSGVAAKIREIEASSKFSLPIDSAVDTSWWLYTYDQKGNLFYKIYVDMNAYELKVPGVEYDKTYYFFVYPEERKDFESTNYFTLETHFSDGTLVGGGWWENGQSFSKPDYSGESTPVYVSIALPSQDTFEMHVGWEACT